MIGLMQSLRVILSGDNLIHKIQKKAFFPGCDKPDHTNNGIEQNLEEITICGTIYSVSVLKYKCFISTHDKNMLNYINIHLYNLKQKSKAM